MESQPDPLLRLRQQLKLHLPRVRRYLGPVLRHGTPRKLANILLAEAELRMGRTSLRARPYYYLIDICNLCNLKCPLCATGIGELGRAQGMMGFDEYRDIFDRVKRDALTVSLYNHGEPFLNPDILPIIEYTSRNNVGTQVSSNFNWPNPVDPEGIVRSGLEYVTVSLDGVTQETYERYRVKGEIEQVFENMKRVLAAKKALGSKTPFVEWQFIVFKHAQHEMERARELAAEWGVDLLRFVAPGFPPEMMGDTGLREEWLPDDPLYSERNPAETEERGYVYDRNCFYLYRSMAIYPGGGVSPCCFAHERNHDFGDIKTQSVQEIWNNASYRAARSLFNGKPAEPDREPVICDECPMFRQAEHAGGAADAEKLQA